MPSLVLLFPSACQERPSDLPALSSQICSTNLQDCPVYLPLPSFPALSYRFQTSEQSVSRSCFVIRYLCPPQACNNLLFCFPNSCCTQATSSLSLLHLFEIFRNEPELEFLLTADRWFHCFWSIMTRGWKRYLSYIAGSMYQLIASSFIRSINGKLLPI